MAPYCPSRLVCKPVSSSKHIYTLQYIYYILYSQTHIHYAVYILYSQAHICTLYSICNILQSMLNGTLISFYLISRFGDFSEQFDTYLPALLPLYSLPTDPDPQGWFFSLCSWWATQRRSGSARLVVYTEENRICKAVIFIVQLVGYTQEIRIRYRQIFSCVQLGGPHTGDPDPLDRNFSYYCVADGDPDCVAGDVHTHRKLNTNPVRRKMWGGSEQQLKMFSPTITTSHEGYIEPV